MLLNKRVIAVAAVCAGFISAVAAAQTTVGTGSVTFSGNVTATTCTVNTAGNVNNVVLPTVSRADVPATASATTPFGATFAINLTNCTLPVPTSKGVAVEFGDGHTNISSTTGNLLNTVASGGTDAQLAFFDLNGTTRQIDLRAPGTNLNYVTPNGSGAATLQYFAGYVRSNPAVQSSAGTFSAPLVLGLTYNY